ncbi:MAG: hypothetical protein WCJ09_11050 [Planctomycetota bacterium]
MRYLVPVLRLAVELASQSAPEDKLGGLAWGLSPSQWPTCRECGKSQSLLAQFIHHPPRLDLGKPGRILSVFQCNHKPGMCATWDGGSGANACFVTEPENLIPELAMLPNDLPRLEREARIVEWLERDDGIDEGQVTRFFSPKEFFDLPESEAAKPTWSTRLGSVPQWLQSPEVPADGWTFIGQLDSTYSFFSPPKSETAGIVEDIEKWEGRSHFCDGPNFGDGGIAYLFLRQNQSIPEGWFFWQCG